MDVVALLKAQRDKVAHQLSSLDTAITALSGWYSSRESKGRRTVSAATRARIAAAQRARWAKAKGQRVTPIVAQRRRRRISAVGIARISAAARARRAKVDSRNLRDHEVAPKTESQPRCLDVLFWVMHPILHPPFGEQCLRL